MIITTSNVLLGKSPTVTTGANPDYDAVNVVDPDFSTSYQSSNNQYLTIDFGAVNDISYVAFAGINIAGSKDFTSRCSVLDGNTTLYRNFVSNNNCVVISFTQRSFSNLRVVLYNDSGDRPPAVNFIAAGDIIQVPNNGETAGYNRQFLNRNTTTKSSLNASSAPTAYLRKKVSANGNLRIPNASKSFSEDQWQGFLDFSQDNYFFIREQDPEPVVNFQNVLQVNNDSAYLCYDVGNNAVTAHSQTRALNDISINFKVFNGL